MHYGFHAYANTNNKKPATVIFDNCVKNGPLKRSAPVKTLMLPKGSPLTVASTVLAYKIALKTGFG